MCYQGLSVTGDRQGNSWLLQVQRRCPGPDLAFSGHCLDMAVPFQGEGRYALLDCPPHLLSGLFVSGVSANSLDLESAVADVLCGK